MKFKTLTIPCLYFISNCFGAHLEAQLIKRTDKEGTSDVDIFNRGSFIGIKAHVGSPSQEVELLLDTGSANSWIMAAQNPYCADATVSNPIKNGNKDRDDSGFFDDDDGSDDEDDDDFIVPGVFHSKGPAGIGSQPCYKYGVFDKDLSSTYSQSGDKFHVTYLDHSIVDGFWSNDSMRIGDQYNLTEFNFGIGLNSNSSIGILGLGIPEFKVKDGEIQYKRDNFVMKLNKQGLIGRRVFSIYLNHQNTDGGKILFGAVDYAKFQSPLITMKMVNTEHTGNPIQRYELMLTDVGFKKNKDEDEISLFGGSETYNGRYTGASIDSGATFNYLPTELFEELISQLHHIKIDSNDQYLVESIEDDNDDVKLSFKFSSHRFHIPLRNFLLPKPNSYNKYINSSKSPNGKEYSLLNIMPQPSNYTILGQSFMRSLYTVFDMDKMEISMAPVKYTDKSEIKEVTIKDGLLNATKDRDVAEELRLGIYDPQSEFVQDTKNGYYKRLSSGCSGIKSHLNNQHIAKALLSLISVFILMFFV